jgi:hypothetical protein
MQRSLTSSFHRFARIGAIGLLLAWSAAAAPTINVLNIVQWLPVTEEERNLKAPRIDPEAGAEGLFWHVWVVDSLQDQDAQTVFYHYLRIKIFNQRGCEEQGTPNIEYWGGHAILDVAGRTIKPDGTVLELGKDAVFKRDIVKAGGVKFKAVSFAMPGVEPGAIIEYRWREVRDRQLANYVRLQFQRDIPIHEVKYFVHPLLLPDVLLPEMKLVPFQAPIPHFVQERDDFRSVTMKDVPAFKEEPMMPSEWELESWGLLYYAEHHDDNPDKFWAGLGKKIYGEAQTYLKVNDTVRRAADEAVAGAKDPEEKLSRLLRYCRTKVRSLNAEDISDLDLIRKLTSKAQQNHVPAEILKRGVGVDFDLNVVFAAMAIAEGFETRLVRMADRDDYPFNRTFTDDYFMRSWAVAIKTGDQWRFYDPAARQLPAGMLRWQKEGVQALVSDPKAPVFVSTPYSPAEKSVTSQKGAFKVDEDGTLEGEVTMTFTGHQAARRRRARELESPAQREEHVREVVQSRYAGAEVSAMKVENVEDPEKPLAYSYRVKVPGYAQRTGKRLFVPMNYFERGEAPPFTSSERKHPVVFDYSYTEEDHVTMSFPQDFSVESPAAPAPLRRGSIGNYEVTLKTGPAELTLERRLVFGNGGPLRFGLETYPALKKAFEVIRDRDQTALVLRQKSL